MTWFDVDGARLYLAGRSPQHDEPIEPEFKPTRKTVYLMVAAGLGLGLLFGCVCGFAFGSFRQL